VGYATTQGTKILPGGYYHISIDSDAMGAGEYEVYFNRKASLEVTPPSAYPVPYDFGNFLENKNSTG